MQTWLAAYFCVIDLALVCQYWYYGRLYPSPAQPHPPPLVAYASTLSSSPYASVILSPPASHRRTLSQPGPPLHASSSKPSHSNGHTWSGGALSHVQGAPSRSPRLNTHILPESSYSAIYEAALDVARTAERAVQRRQNSRQRLLERSRRNTSTSQPTVEEEDDEDMRASWRSERSKASSAAHSGTEDEDAYRRMTMSTGTLLVRGRARGRERAAGIEGSGPGSGIRALSIIPAEEQGVDADADADVEPGAPLVVETRKVKSRSLSLARRTQSSRSGKARAAAGMAFMSLGLVARYSGGGIGGARDGRGAEVARRAIFEGSVVPALATPADTAVRIWSHPALMVFPPDSGTSITFVDLSSSSSSASKDPPTSSPDYQRMVGRISAWACTTLYLTSRLPQIWKNFTRRSVEGLSILLFLFAFLGNTLYVMSILLNPGGTTRRETRHYLLEALPYLLGSGGTLVFDLTIMVQSWMYGSRPPVSASEDGVGRPGMRRSRSRPTTGRRRTKGVEDAVEAGRGERSPLLGSTGGASSPWVQGSPVVRDGHHVG